MGLLAGVVALGLLAATPALASGGWGFGMGYGPAVVASCSGYNLVAAKVDVPAGSYAGYVTGRLTNPRTNTSRRPTFGVDKVTAAGTPTLTYIIFNPPLGTLDGDVLHVALTLSSSPSMTPVAGSFEFSYRCATGEVIRPPAVDAINMYYGDTWVALANVQDDQGKPALQIWCLDPLSQPYYKGLTLTQALFAKVPAHPSVNTLIDKNNTCSVPVAAYVLTTGEYQVTIGPDPYGVINEVVFTGLPPTNVYFVRFNVDQLPIPGLAG
jgi:hypothetical protein